MAETDQIAIGGGVIHVVEDDEAVREALSLMLGVRGFRVRAHPSAVAFLAALPAAETGAILTDVMMPGMTGVEMLRELRRRGVDWPAIVICGRATREMAEEAMALSATAVLDKPFDPSELVAIVRQVAGDPV